MRKHFKALWMMMLCIVSALTLCVGLAACGKEPDPDPVAVTGVTLNKTELALEVEGSETLIATVTPTNATNKNVTWESDDEDVATVASGVVTAVGEGTATITVKTVDGEKTATCAVTVTKAGPDTVSVTGVTLDKDTLDLVFGGADADATASLTATVVPAEATNKNVTWESSNEDVATVANGVVTAVGEGTATITVKTVDGAFEAECEVTVTAHTHTAALDAVYTPNGETHTYTCETCGKTASENHTATDEWEIDEENEKHYQECSTCGGKFNEAAHEEDPEPWPGDNDNHVYKCTVCETELRTESHTNASGTYTSKNGFFHMYYCEKCNVEVVLEHTTEWVAKPDGEYFGCKFCDWGWGSPVRAHDLKYFNDGATHYQYCTNDKCTYKTEPEAHDYTYSRLENQADGHSGVCECGHTITSEAHDTNDNGKCSKCGYDSNHTVHVDNADAQGYYDGLCDECGEIVDGTWTFANGVITAYSGSYTKVKIPSAIGGVAVTEFGTIFQQKNITDIIIPDSITKLGQSFSKCASLKTVIVLANVAQLPNNFLGNCSALEWVVLAASFNNIATSVFGTSSSTTTLNAIYYLGESWEDVTVGTNAANLISKQNTKIYTYSDSQKDDGWHWSDDAHTIPAPWNDAAAASYALPVARKED